MTDDVNANRGLLVLVAVLVLALVVVFVLWQQDQESKDVKLDIETSDAGALVEPAPSQPDGGLGPVELTWTEELVL